MGKQNFCVVEEVRICMASVPSVWRTCKFFKSTSDNGCKYREGNTCENAAAWKDSKEKVRQLQYHQRKLTA